MNSADHPRAVEIGRSNSAHAMKSAQLAKELEAGGAYEEAREVLKPWWKRIGVQPVLTGLDEHGAGEILMRVGSLAGWIGSARQITSSSAFAESLLRQSIEKFEKLEEDEKIAEALCYLGTVYRRSGAFQKAQDVLAKAIQHLDNSGSETHALVILNIAVVASCEGRHEYALSVLDGAASIFAQIQNHSHLGKYHNTLAVALKNLWEDSQSLSYLDRALISFDAASYHFEQVGHDGFRAAVENNLGSFLFSLNRIDEAVTHLHKAARLFELLKDQTHVAQVEEVRARVELARGRHETAERLAERSVWRLDNGNENAVLIESLITYGKVLARHSKLTEARKVFARAEGLAQNIGNTSLVNNIARMQLEEGLGYTAIEAGLTTKEIIRAFEKGLFRQALIRTQRSVSRAATLLGLRRQTFIFALETRHPDLLAERSPINKRTDKSKFAKPAKASGAVIVMPAPASPTSIYLEFPSGFQPVHKYLVVKMHSKRLKHLGVQASDWIVIDSTSRVIAGDLIAVHYALDEVYSVWYLRKDKQLELGSERALLESGMTISGKIIGYAPANRTRRTEGNRAEVLSVILL